MSIAARDGITKSLLTVEQAVDKHGWDEPATLGALHMTRDDILKVIRIPLPPSSNDCAMLARLAKVTLTEPDLSSLHLPSDFYGLVFVHEAWVLTGSDPERLVEHLRSGKPMADHPDREEVRQLAAVDIYGRMFWIHRTRGQEPEVLDDTRGLLSIGGRVLESLRQLTLAFARSIPDSPADLEALEMLWVDRVDDTIVRLEAQQELRKK